MVRLYVNVIIIGVRDQSAGSTPWSDGVESQVGSENNNKDAGHIGEYDDIGASVQCQVFSATHA